MKVIATGYEESLKRIASDQRVAEITDHVIQYPNLLGLVLQIIRRFNTVAELESGKGGNKHGTLARVVADYNHQASRRERSAKARIGEFVYELYRDHAPGEANVRGALLEALVERQLRTRYAGTDHMLANNLRFRLEHGRVLYDSGKKSIDVLGFDGDRGECHDCKVNAGRFEKDWVEELIKDVAPHGFLIGLATTDYEPMARKKLTSNGIRFRGAQILTPEQLHMLTPLQQV